MTVITPDEVARRLGITGSLTPEQEGVMNGAIEDAEDDVIGYLEQPLTTTQVTLEGLLPKRGGDLDDWKTWPQALHQLEHTYSVASHTANGDGTHDVTFNVGLDVANDPQLRPIRKWIRAKAVEDLRNNPDLPYGKRRTSSVSADGQSISYSRPPAQVEPVPPLSTLSRWKLRTGLAYQRPRPPATPWPYDFDPFPRH